MSESLFDSDGTRQNSLETLIEGCTAVSRYDLALGIIPVAFVVSIAVSAATGLRLIHALAPAALVGILVIVDACYLNPPIDP
jgi:hypothetical protein